MESSGSEVLAAAREVIRREARGVAAVAERLDDSFVEVVQLASGCTGKVFVTGSGTNAAVARRMAHLLAVCGTPTLFLPAMDALHGTMGAVASGDVMITISRGGESAELNELAQRLRQRGVPVVALTAVPGSTLGRLADVVVVLDTDDELDPGGVIAMGSTLATSAWGDALACVLMRLRGYRWEDVLFTHPAGAVGTLDVLPAELPPLGLADGPDAED